MKKIHKITGTAILPSRKGSVVMMVIKADKKTVKALCAVADDVTPCDIRFGNLSLIVEEEE
jgi:hypothetical protein